MADDEMIKNESAVGIADNMVDAAAPPQPDAKPKDKKKDDDDLEYEVEFATPFGKLEFEFEPLAKKEKKDRERKAKAERDAAKKALKAAEKMPHQSGGFFGKLLLVLVILGLIGAVIAAAYWLFARPGEDEDLDAIPPEFAHEPEPVAQGVVARARGRINTAISAGRRASREAQQEQREKLEEMTGR